MGLVGRFARLTDRLVRKGVDGEEKFRRVRPDRVVDPLACGPVPAPTVGDLGIDCKTIAKYLAPAIAESLTPGEEPVSEAGWAAHVARWFPEVADPGLRATTWPGIEVYRDQIRDWLKAEVSAATVAQRLRDDYAYSGGILSAAVVLGEPVRRGET